MTPIIKKAPGGEIKKINGCVDKPGSLNSCLPNISRLPVPSISLRKEIIIRAIVKPKPIPSASAAESNTEFLDANASARPKIIQFTTISGRYIPNDL